MPGIFFFWLVAILFQKRVCSLKSVVSFDKQAFVIAQKLVVVFVVVVVGRDRDRGCGGVVVRRWVAGMQLRLLVIACCCCCYGCLRLHAAAVAAAAVYRKLRPLYLSFPSEGAKPCCSCLDAITGKHSNQNQIWLIKVEGCMDLWVHRGFYLLLSPSVTLIVCYTSP